MRTNLGKCFLGLIVIWSFLVAFYVPWHGIRYERSRSSSTADEWTRCGSFNLKNDTLPLWNPPKADPWANQYSRWTVRWPGQEVSHQRCVEIAFGRLVLRWCMGLVVIGLVIGGITRLFFEKQSNPLVDFGWWLAIGELLACLILMLVKSTPLALAFGDPAYSNWILTLFCIAGGVVGVSLFCFDRRAKPSVGQIPHDAERESQDFDRIDSASTEVSWFPRFTLLSLMLLTLVICVFLGQLFGFDRLPNWAHEQSLIVFAVIYALSPIAMWWLPKGLRWALWISAYFGLFVGAYFGKDVPQGVVLAFGSLVGVFAGLVVNRWRDSSNNRRRKKPPNYSLAVFGFIAGLFCLIPTVPLFVSATDFLRGEQIGVTEWAGSVRQYDDEVMMFLGCIYAVIGLMALRTWLIVSGVGWWKGMCFGAFFFATAFGVLAACFH